MVRTGIVAGVGPGLGESLARKFAEEGCDVRLFARSADYIEELAAELANGAGDAVAVPTALADPDQIAGGFEEVRSAFGPVDVLVYHASAAPWKGLSAVGDTEFDTARRGVLRLSLVPFND